VVNFLLGMRRSILISRRRFFHLAACLVICLAFILSPIISVQAQEGSPTGPVYIVKEGDSLWAIAARFGVSVADLQRANGISDASQLVVGTRLIIPGLEGIEGVIDTKTLPFGETLRSLSRRYLVTEQNLARLNRLTAPVELFAGNILIIPEQPDTNLAQKRIQISEGQSLLELAALDGTNPWQIAGRNRIANTWSVLPGDVLRSWGTADDKTIDEGPGALPGTVKSLSVDPLSFLQGKAGTLIVDAPTGVKLVGNFMDHPLNFFPLEGKGWYAMQGIHAMTEPGLYPLEISGQNPDGTGFNFSQMVRVKAVDYPYDEPLAVNPTTIDPAVTRPEDEQWNTLAAPVTPERYWNGVFTFPSPLDVNYCLETGECWTSQFGNRRSYNGSAYDYFHTGLDIAGRTGTDIYAAADGVVVFSGPLTVRGNATMINHGQGVYTGYMHQSEILVKPGDIVKAGQLIGRVGGTGRVEAPHLHWEVWVGGVQVDPLDWLSRSYP
jgi:murein DD-endopeptidase MepM/ murein hydrolase activator NlpD